MQWSACRLIGPMATVFAPACSISVSSSDVMPVWSPQDEGGITGEAAAFNTANVRAVLLQVQNPCHLQVGQHFRQPSGANEDAGRGHGPFGLCLEGQGLLEERRRGYARPGSSGAVFRPAGQSSWGLRRPAGRDRRRHLFGCRGTGQSWRLRCGRGCRDARRCRGCPPGKSSARWWPCGRRTMKLRMKLHNQARTTSTFRPLDQDLISIIFTTENIPKRIITPKANLCSSNRRIR